MILETLSRGMNELKREGPGMRHLGKLLIASMAVIVLAGIYLCWHIESVTRNAYCQWWVADMVIEHLKANHGQWPRSWDDDRDDYYTCVARSGPAWKFEELRNRVSVDWNASIDELKAAPASLQKPPFKAIWATDGSSDNYWENREPNQMIWDYLHQ